MPYHESVRRPSGYVSSDVNSKPIVSNSETIPHPSPSFRVQAIALRPCIAVPSGAVVSRCRGAAAPRCPTVGALHRSYVAWRPWKQGD